VGNEKGWSSGGSAPRGGKNGGGVHGFKDMDQHGTDTAAPGCSDSGGQRMPHRHGGRVRRTGDGGGARVTRATDRRGRAGRLRARWAAAGCGRERERVGQHGAGH
jgi:hypothetical protein